MKYVIFAPDDQSPEGLASLKAAFAASDKTKNNLVSCVGSYKGVEEKSFLCRAEDFHEFIRPAGFVEEQESILYVSECNKQYVTLYDLRTGEVTGLGSMHQMKEAEALQYAAWTYRPDLDIYWVAKPGNPDRVPSEESDEPLQIKQGLFRRIWDEWWPELLSVVLAVLIWLFIASPAESQAAPQDGFKSVDWIALSDQDDNAVMAIYLHNIWELGVPDQEVYIFNTIYGEFTVLHERTYNDECGPGVLCPDSLTLIDWPDGYAADAMTINVPEGGIEAIRIYRVLSA